jgi:hypothetical protein
MKSQNRRWWILGIVLVTLVILSIVFPPQPYLLQGSTYSRAPSGYGAWYAFMQAEGIPVQRWQRPLDQLGEISEGQTVSTAAAIDKPITLIRATPEGYKIARFDENWVERGNVLVLLGYPTSVSRSPFRSTLSSAVGGVRVETTRRLDPGEFAATRQRLSDQYGAVILERKLGQGKVIYASTAFLAANAYQKEAGNFQFLKQLVTEPGHPIWVDEYLHGYKDPTEIAQETDNNLLVYWSRTPILLVVMQVGVILAVLLWGHNQRLGPPVTIKPAMVDNSDAYIQALATVLQKADCSEFVVATVGKAEQLRLQRSLGLSNELLEPQVVATAWSQQTGRPSSDLEPLLSISTQPRRLSSQELWGWIEKIQAIRRYLD